MRERIAMNSDRPKSYKRATAIKMHIDQINSGNYVKSDTNSYLETTFGVQVSRVHILGTIVGRWVSSTNDDSKPDRTPQASIIVDDSTETIRVRVWKDDVKLFEDLQIGDIVNIVGRVREYETEKYISPEIVKKIENPNWELIHELEIIEFLSRLKSDTNLQKISTEAQQITSTDSEPMKIDQNQKSIFKDKIVDLINELDKGSGVNINQLKEDAKIPENEFQNAIMELINEGAIYQPSPGKYRKL